VALLRCVLGLRYGVTVKSADDMVSLFFSFLSRLIKIESLS